MLVKIAMRVLSYALKKDPEYAWSWHCNIAMNAYDAANRAKLNPTETHKIANEYAASFMRLAFGVDTSKNRHYIFKGGR